MLEHWLLMAAILGFCLYVLFYSCMLLIAPNRCPPTYKWGQPSLRLVRKPPLELGKRFTGLCGSVVIVVIFLRPLITRMFHPAIGEVSWGKSPFAPEMPRWDALGFGLFGTAAGYYLLMHPKRSVELMFSADTSRLKDKTTVRIWTFAVQTAAFGIMLASLVMLAGFIRSLRNR